MMLLRLTHQQAATRQRAPCQAPSVVSHPLSKAILKPSCGLTSRSISKSTCNPLRDHAQSPLLGLARPPLRNVATAVASFTSSGISSFDDSQGDLNWLKKLPAFASVDDRALTDLLAAVEVVDFSNGQTISMQNSIPGSVAIIRQGVASVTQPYDDTAVAGVRKWLRAGTVLHWRELVNNTACTTTVTVSSGTLQLWTLPAAGFQQLLARYPSLSAVQGQLASRELEEIQEQLQRAAARDRVLKPYLVPSPKYGIIGTSKYADRLRKQVVAAARAPAQLTNPITSTTTPAGTTTAGSSIGSINNSSTRHVVVFGEPGLQKANIAALIHFGGPARGLPCVMLDCTRMDHSGVELFGRGDKEGLLGLLDQGMLVLRDIHKLPASLMPRLQQYLRDGTFRPIEPQLPAAAADDREVSVTVRLPPLMYSAVRVVMTASRQVPALDGLTTLIKVPPLRVRPRDVKDMQKYFLTDIARRRGVSGNQRMVLTPAAVRRLESYSWPGNIAELAATVERAATQGDALPSGASLGEEVFWFTAQQAKDRLTLNLLTAYPLLKRFLRSEFWPDAINFKFTAYLFPVIVALLLFGPQDRLHNPALAVFWDAWWPLVFVSYLFLGRVWCAVCPFMIYGELVQRWRLSTGAKLLKWPRDNAEQYGPWFLYLLFGVILVWEEVWDLPNSAALSGWLLIIITVGAMVCSAIFERRLWCRYLCPIGGMNGMFAKLSMTEVRARQGVCSGECTTYQCYKGGPAQPPEGLESPGCPLYSHPAQLVDNKNCTNCMECLKACPNTSVQVNLRLPGADLWFAGHKGSVSELALQFMLLGAVYLHHLPQLASQLGQDPLLLQGTTLAHVSVSWALLLAPGAAAYATDTAMRAWAVKRGVPEPAEFVTLAYGYMPLVWGATLAHYLGGLLMELGHILPITAAMFGWEDAPLPTVAAHPAVLSFLQGTLLLGTGAASAVLTRKLGSQPWLTLAPQVALMGVMTAELYALIVQ